MTTGTVQFSLHQKLHVYVFEKFGLVIFFHETTRKETTMINCPVIVRSASPILRNEVISLTQTLSSTLVKWTPVRTSRQVEDGSWFICLSYVLCSADVGSSSSVIRDDKGSLSTVTQGKRGNPFPTRPQSDSNLNAVSTQGQIQLVGVSDNLSESRRTWL